MTDLAHRRVPCILSSQKYGWRRTPIADFNSNQISRLDASTNWTYPFVAKEYEVIVLLDTSYLMGNFFNNDKTIYDSLCFELRELLVCCNKAWLVESLLSSLNVTERTELFCKFVSNEWLSFVHTKYAPWLVT